MISVFGLTAALAQLPTAPLIPGAPTESCSYLQAPADTATRLLAGKGDIPYQFSCKENRCRVGALTPGDIVPLLAEKNGWSCVASDLTSGWVPADRVTPMPDEPEVNAEEWVGWWQTGTPNKGHKGNRLLITPGTGTGTLKISGRAYWYGANDNVHLGGIQTEHVMTVGPYLRAVEGDTLSGCVLDLKFDPTTHTFAAHDNLGCGGMNVRFMGVWRKFTPTAADKKDAAQPQH